MAYLSDDEKKKQDGTEDPNGGQSSAQVVAPSSGGGIVGGAQSANTAGVGAGGSGGWTNIQSYLDANKGDMSSTNMLNSNVGGAFDKDQNDFNTQSGQAKDSAKSAVDSNHIGNDQAGSLLDQAGKDYNYGGDQSQQYKDETGKLKNSLGASYGGPTTFGYGLSADTQNYGANLGDDKGFGAIMNGLYNKSAGGQMGSGALTLQHQLDVNDSNLTQARSGLKDRFSAVTDAINSGVADTNKSLADSQTQFKGDQTALKGYLTGAQGTDQTRINNAAGSWNTAEQNAYQSAQAQANSLKAQALNDPRYAAWAAPQAQTNGNKQMGGNFDTFGNAVADNGQASWTQNPLFGLNTSVDPSVYVSRGQTADATNANGVDDQRNQYNSISDVLGSTSKINKAAGVNSHAAFDEAAMRKYLQLGGGSSGLAKVTGK